MSRLTEVQWLYAATAFEFPLKPQRDVRFTEELPIRIEARVQRDGSKLWCVKQGGNCLRKDGEWELEMQPSSREFAWLALTRWDTYEEAYADAVRLGALPCAD